MEAGNSTRADFADKQRLALSPVFIGAAADGFQMLRRKDAPFGQAQQRRAEVVAPYGIMFLYG